MPLLNYLRRPNKRYIPYSAVPQRRLFAIMGMNIQFPGNHCLEYKEREMMGKYNTRVNQTRK